MANLFGGLLEPIGSIRNWLGNGLQRIALAVSVKIDDSPGWVRQNGRSRHDRDQAEADQLYDDVLTAWRKNPLAWRTVQITTDYVVGETITISSEHPQLQNFIEAFWNHPKNRMANRLETMCEELTRSGDLFPLLFLNKHSGMSYIRFLTQDQIDDIETQKTDWETELIIKQRPEGIGDGPRSWYTPNHGRSKTTNAIALHYAINRPMGALFGESDLASIVPWLLRYSRMLEGRIRLHWAARAFLWFVQVPTNKVKEKQEQYAAPPEAGSVIVHDDAEEWKVQTPNLRGTDAEADMTAVKRMIGTGTGYPPHWLGEPGDVNLSTAQAMQEPAERHLIRRQNYFVFILSDILWHAYQRASMIDAASYPAITETNYKKLFHATVPDISRADNERLATAGKEMTAVMQGLAQEFPGSNTLKRLMLRLVLKFAGEPQDDEFLDDVLKEAKDMIQQPAAEPAEAQPDPKANGHNKRKTVPAIPGD
jgi:hypothetical protein